jgi:hypothetical protein
MVSQLSSSGTSSTSGPSSGPAAAPAGQSVGPRVTYGPGTSSRSIQTVTSTTNFVPARLAAQAEDAVRAARLKGVHSGPNQVSALPDVHSSSAGVPVGRAGVSNSQLESCIDAIVPGRTVLLVELAKFKGKDATIIVTAATKVLRAEAWVVGPLCSAAHHDVLDHVTLAGS